MDLPEWEPQVKVDNQPFSSAYYALLFGGWNARSHLYDQRLPIQSLCSCRHPQCLPSAFLKLSHLATPQRPADVSEVCRDDDGRTRPSRFRMGQHHPRRRSSRSINVYNLVFHARIQGMVPHTIRSISSDWSALGARVYGVGLLAHRGGYDYLETPKT